MVPFNVKLLSFCLMSFRNKNFLSVWFNFMSSKIRSCRMVKLKLCHEIDEIDFLSTGWCFCSVSSASEYFWTGCWWRSCSILPRSFCLRILLFSCDLLAPQLDFEFLLFSDKISIFASTTLLMMWNSVRVLNEHFCNIAINFKWILVAIFSALCTHWISFSASLVSRDIFQSPDSMSLIICRHLLSSLH